MDVRCGYRRYRRQHKRHRLARFDNRSASKRKNYSEYPAKKDAILRILHQLNQWVNIQEYYLEDVAIDIRARRFGGADTIGNLIILCSKCHQKTGEFEE